MSEKLQKVLARAGFGSRRELETWISAGRIKINRITAQLGDRVESSDLIEVDGKRVSERRLQLTPIRTLIYHKDAGIVCTRSDPEGRPTIFDRLPRVINGRWVAVGRLDISTTGVLLMTTDGELANRLMHPSQEIEREYLVRILGKVSNAALLNLSKGVLLEDGVAKFNRIIDTGGDGANHWYRVTLNEGRNREVRRLWESQGLTVSRLSRIKFGPIVLQKKLRRGEYEEIGPKQLQELYSTVGMSVPKDLAAARTKRNNKYRKLR